VWIDTDHSGGWYDVTLTTPSDPSFAVELAGRLESARRLTSDPQLGRPSSHATGDHFRHKPRRLAPQLIRK
jgi:hypothetical protein